MKKAFTMIELMVVIAIIAILMTVLIGSFSGSTDSARAAKCQTNMRNLAMAVQAYSMDNSSKFPFAGSFTWESKSSKSTRSGTTAGWISWPKGNSSYTYPGETDIATREHSLTNGAIWKGMNGSRESYYCPCHNKLFQSAGLNVAPLWSYVMSAYFRWDSGGKFARNRSPVYRTSLKRAERVLLFAELPFLAQPYSSDASDPSVKAGASETNDPILQYTDCLGGGNESIGFNHKSGRQTFAHVCFADGHVERFVAPKEFTESDAKELTNWLCQPSDKDTGDDFDVSFDGSKYQKMTKTN